MQNAFAMHFLGVGNSHAQDLGCSAAVLERAAEPSLLIDCGPDTLAAFRQRYGNRLPKSVFITHTHLDHVGGLENLFYRAWLDPVGDEPVRLYVPVRLVAVLHQRIADYPGLLAEGGVNFWDAFQLVPVSEHFWHDGLLFTVFPVRHHELYSAYGVALEGVFLYSGDTRPIPEIVTRLACRGEQVFHDACVGRSPSHTGIHEVESEYSPEQRARMVFYHYGSDEAGRRIEAMGYRIARRGDSFALRAGLPGSPASGKPRVVGL